METWRGLRLKFILKKLQEGEHPCLVRVYMLHFTCLPVNKMLMGKMFVDS